ncbi:beta-galactosidase-1-like protein [Platysternon megacephalum]|uniref:Beta-galactosidase-1-like protein n=1 Tax=Platysternon megacephalum TaxID=55544 RepID=A0A4D9DQB1_9SAUR|nr:beta-galactosidase-1-like protein [Platysternon megacephalum]
MTLPSLPMYPPPSAPYNLKFQQDAAGFGVMSLGSFGGPALLSLLREEDVARSTGKLPLNHCSSLGGLPHATTPGFLSPSALPAHIEVLVSQSRLGSPTLSQTESMYHPKCSLS